MANKYTKTISYIIFEIYNSQKKHSIKRGHKPPSYTQYELEQWLKSQPDFFVLYDNWRLSKYNTELKPSVDRVDDSFGYTMSNIRLTTWRVNRNKLYEQYRENIKTHPVNPQISVGQYDKNGKLIATYHSIMEAERQTGISNGHISKALKGKRKTAGGYAWKKDL